MIVEAENIVNAKKGDRIILSFQTTSFLKASFLIYIFPILCMMTGAHLGWTYAPKFDFDPSGASLFTSFSFFVASIFFIRFQGNKLAKKKEYKPKIIRIIRHGNRTL